MRIALAHPFVWPDVRRGAERYVDDLAWYLVGRGHEVVLITGTEGPSRTEGRSDGVVVHHRHHVGMSKLARVGIDRVQSFLFAALPAFRRCRPDVVHAMVPAASVASTLARVPSVFTFIGHPTRDQYDGLGRGDRLLHRTASRTATTTTALSRASARSVADLFGRRPEVLPPGVRLDRFPMAAAPRSGPPRLLFSAAPGDRRKRLDLVLRAMPAVLDSQPGARLLVSGQGDPGWAVDAVPPASRRRVQDAMDLLGAGTAAEIPARYQSATLTVLPAINEAFGLALVESLASGTPVVAAADGGMVDIVTDRGIGGTFLPGSVDDLTSSLLDVIDLATDPRTPQACAAHARAWGWAESIGPRHEEVYESAAR